MANNWFIHRKVNLALPQCVERVVDAGLLYAGDSQAQRWQVDCYYGNEAADLTGYTAHGYFIRADKATVPVSGTITDNSVEVTLTSACYSVPGLLKGILRIKNAVSGEVVTIGAMCVRVATGETDTVIETEATVSLTELLAQIAAMEKLNSDVTAAEAARVEAENARVSAENTRVTEWAEIKSAAEGATQAATDSAAAANKAAEDANTATSAANEAAENATNAASDILDEIVSATINAENYFTLMRMWFASKAAASETDLNSLCDQWYTITRQGWTGGTLFYHADTSMASTGIKVGDNADMVAEPSTNTTKGQDDYAGVPLFACVDCNWYLDESGKPHITAIDGIAGDFERSNPEKLVGVLQMTGYHKYEDDPTAGTFTHLYTDDTSLEGYSPLPEAVDLDGTVRMWVVHAKYVTGDDFACYSGARPLAYTASHNSMLTNFHKAHGNQYGGKTSADDAFLKLMLYLKYASLTADDILQGCVAYNFQYAVAEQETGVERVIVTAAQGANIKIGSTVMVGNPTAFSSGTTLNVDRSQAGMRAKADRKRVTRKETLESGNVAIYIDNGGVTFDTTANTITNADDSPTYITTSPWYTGTCDDVLGNDGSPSTPGNGTEPVKLQGIEYGMGGYEIVNDCILKYRKDENGKYWLGVYVCRDASKYATSVNANYEAVGYEVECPSASGWQYISELGFDAEHPEVWFPHLIGCTSSQRTKDAIYILASSESQYEWLSLGALSSGVGTGGLSIVHATRGLGYAWWCILARLSATGNRGELAASTDG